VTAEQKSEFLKQAGDLYACVVSMTRGKPALVHQELSARSGQIAVVIDQGDVERARALAKELIARAREMKLDDVAAWHEQRLETLGNALNQPALPLEETIVARFEDTPAQQPAQGGNVIQVPAGQEEMIIPLKPVTPPTEQAPPAPSEGEKPSEPAPPGE